MNRDIGNGRIYVDNGPVQMTIYAERKGILMPKKVNKAGENIESILLSLIKVLPLAKKPWPELPAGMSLPKVLKKMHDAAKATGDPTMTSMCAVAGSFADLTADYLVEKGATKVLVNNGGDIALRLKLGAETNLGIADKVGGHAFYKMTIAANQKIGGVATSGLGGRSFTLGVADAVVVLASTAALADACATYIANTTSISSPFVTKQKASELDWDTDIPDLMVTTSVGNLKNEEIELALEQGYRSAVALLEKDVIKGCLIFVKGRCRYCPDDLCFSRIKG